MTAETTDDANSTTKQPNLMNKLQTRRRNKRLKLSAAAVDRVSTVVFGGAVLAPIFQQQPLTWWKTGAWVLVGLMLHWLARSLIGRLKEEE